jgi:hypothetical protein
MSWTQIKKGDFEQAIRTIDILLLTYPDDASSPRLKLVRGILQQRRKSYDDALDTYQKLVAEYAGIKEELDRIMDHPKDILSYFNDLVDTDLNRMESAFLVPALAVRFALADPNMSRVLELNRDVVTQRTDLENASRLLHDIEQELDNNPPHNLLVGMRRARGGINTLENNVLLARERVLQNEYAYLIQLGDPAVTSKAEAWMREQEEQGRLNRQMPEVQRELSELVDVYEDQLKEVQKNGFKLESQIEDLMAQAAAIEKYISYGRESGAMTAEMEQSTRGKLQEIVGELEEDLRELAGIQEEIKDLDVRRKLKDAFDAEEAAYRRQAAARQEKARENLLAIRSMARGDNSFFRESDALYDRLDGLSGDLNQFYRDLDGIEMQQIAVVRQNIEREKSALFEQGTLAQQYTEEVGGLSEEIAVSAFGNIHQQFSDLILKADFGITDVYWELKEDKTGEIELNQSQRADELGALREKFKELQSGDL